MTPGFSARQFRRLVRQRRGTSCPLSHGALSIKAGPGSRCRSAGKVATSSRAGFSQPVKVHYMQPMTMQLPSISTISDDFAFLDDWEDRYRYIIDLGRELPSLPDSARTEANKVSGCVSQVWIEVDRSTDDDPVLTFTADSDAHIVKGLVAIILAIFSGKRASEILAMDGEARLRELGLSEHLTPQRANGVRAMIARIRQEAASASMA